MRSGSNHRIIGYADQAGPGQRRTSPGPDIRGRHIEPDAVVSRRAAHDFVEAVMALVRRTTVEGRQPTPAPAGLAVPRQPSAADIDEAAAAPTTTEEIGAAPDRPPRLWAIVLALLLVAAAGAGAFLIDDQYAVATLPVTSEAAAIVALLLFAAVVERLLEPFSRWLPGRRARNRYEQQVADLANRLPGASLSSVAVAKARVGQHRAEKALLAWGLGSAVATVLAAAAGVHILRLLIAVEPGAWEVVPVWVDALATGLIVGSGTKPVHDLLTRVQQSNAQRRDPVEG